jgi:hypothetical protein
MEGARGTLVCQLSFSCVYRLFVARGLLKSLSVKQGIKYDALESAKDIPTFIEFHNLDVKEILEPIDSFSKSMRLRATSLHDNLPRDLQRIFLQVRFGFPYFTLS